MNENVNESDVAVAQDEIAKAQSLPPPLTRQDLIMALVADLHAQIRNQTRNPIEATGIAVAVMARCALDMHGGDVERMAKQMQEIKNKVVSDFRRMLPRGKGPR